MPDPSDADFLRQFLDGHDRPCPGCGYNLRDLKSPQCPECGQGLLLSLRLAEPRQGSLITGLIGLAAGAGFNGLFLLFVAIVMLFVRGRIGAGRFIAINGSGLLVHAAAIFFWIRSWNRIRTASTATRRLLVILCWALPILYLVVFAAIAR